MTTPDRPHYAVLIDADNVAARFAHSIFEEIASLGEASIRRIYGDFSAGPPQGWTKDILVSLAINAHQQFANTINKNASDIALVIDAMDILHSGNFDGFVLISSDSDFTRLASRIREQGLDVYGMGERKTPASFIAACKRFIFLENLEAPISDNSANGDGAKNIDPPSKARPLITAAMAKMDPDAEWVALGPLGQQINAANPGFDPRNYGCRNLSTLLKKAGQFDVEEIGGSLKVRSKN